MTKSKESSFWKDLLEKLLKVIVKGLGGKSGRKKTHNQHVVPHSEGWAVKGEGNERYTAKYKHQDDAIDRAKDIAENYGSDVIIHRRDGTIRDRRSY